MSISTKKVGVPVFSFVVPFFSVPFATPSKTGGWYFLTLRLCMIPECLEEHIGIRDGKESL